MCRGMSEMVERVVGVLQGELRHEFTRDDLKEAARAAIAAMRQPTAAMLSALPYPGPEDYPTASWRAMIDAALK